MAGTGAVKERLWTRDFITVALMNFSHYMVFYLLLVIIAGYAVDKFGASTGVAGLASGLFIIGILIGRVWAGRVIEGIGHKRLLIMGTISYVIASLLYLAIFNLTMLMVVRLLHGIAFGIASNATHTIIAHIIPPARRGEGIGYYTMGTITAAALGPFLGFMLIQHSDITTVFIVTSILPVVSLGIACLVRQPERAGSAVGEAKETTTFRLSNYLDYKALPISIIIVVIGGVYSSLLIFLKLYTREIHLEEAAGFFFPIYAATVILSRPFTGRLLDTKGANFVVYPCLSIFAVGMLLFGQARGRVSLLLAAVIIGIGYGNFLSIAQAIAIKVVPPHRLGLATSTFWIFLDVGFGMGPYILGSIVPLTGYRGLYILMVAVIVATMGLYHVLHGRKAVVSGEAG